MLSADRVRAAMERALADRGVAAAAGEHGLDGDFDVLGSGIVDSLAFVELLLAVEQSLGTPLPLEQLDFTRMGSLDAIVEQLTAL